MVGAAGGSLGLLGAVNNNRDVERVNQLPLSCHKHNTLSENLLELNILSQEQRITKLS